MSRDNIIYVGKKPPMTYVMAVLGAMNNQDDDIILKARGRSITTAVDTAEICRRRYLQDIKKPVIVISTERLENLDGQLRNVSAISITLSRGAEKPVKPEKQTEEQPEAEPEEEPEKPAAKETPLSEISGVGAATAKKLTDAGYVTAEQVAEADPDGLAEKAGISVKVATKIVEAARSL
ncbi:MAG: DNA-binding protein Alba [Candidatus Bathyarchaeota archaeon]|nr:DNA-binding protein Alba [Candidatus Bathyarchaeota archaeon]